MSNPTERYHFESDTTTVSAPRVHVPHAGKRTFMALIVDEDGTVTACEAVSGLDMDVSGDDFYQRIVKPALHAVQARLTGVAKPKQA